MVKCSILSGESSYKREFLPFNAPWPRPSLALPRSKRKRRIRSSSGFFPSIPIRDIFELMRREFSFLLLREEYMLLYDYNTPRLQFLKRGREARLERLEQRDRLKL